MAEHAESQPPTFIAHQEELNEAETLWETLSHNIQLLKEYRRSNHTAFIERNFADLVDVVTLHNTRLWEELIQSKVISLEDISYIQERNPAKRDQVRQVLTGILYGNLQDFHKFQEALHKIFHVVSVEQNHEAVAIYPPASEEEIEDIRKQLQYLSLPANVKYNTSQENEEIRRKTECYKMTRKPRGHALVVTMTFNRTGWKEDVKELHKMFLYLNINVDVDKSYLFDLSEKELFNALNQFASNPGYTKDECLFVVLMGHGGKVDSTSEKYPQERNKEYLRTADGCYFYMPDTLRVIFDNRKYEHLDKIPKVFLLQMCRGGKKLRKTTFPASDGVEADADEQDKAPIFNDYILGYSTQPDTPSFRDLFEGSWYIQDICRVFIEKASCCDVTKMLIEVNRKAQEKRKEGEYMQISETVLALQYDLFLFPEEQSAVRQESEPGSSRKRKAQVESGSSSKMQHQGDETPDSKIPENQAETQKKRLDRIPAQKKRPSHERFSSEMLCEERKQQLDIIKEKHSELPIASSKILRKLLEKSIIDDDDKKEIESADQNATRVSKLVDIFKGLTNRKYEEFCEILDAGNLGHVVHTLLVTAGDFQHAAEKMARYFKTEFTGVQLYSPYGEEMLTDIDQIYIRMTWKAINTATSMREEEMSSYFQLFEKLKKHDQTHLAISGVPGAGKTTFMKHICHQWAKLVLEEEMKDVDELGLKLLGEYKFVIPIILRLVKGQQTLSDIITDQFSKLPKPCKLHVHCVLQAIQKYPLDVLVIFDGFDELTSSKELIHHILNKALHPDVTVVVTTRPHGIMVIKQKGANPIDQLSMLIGFTHDQIKEYIFKCGERGLEKPQQLWDDLNKEQSLYLLELARVPIHLQMICYVWKNRKSMGSTTADLYIMFISCLHDHLEKKYPQVGKLREDDILKKDSDLLAAVSRLAFTWNGSQLQTTFTDEQLQEILQNQYELGKDLGCITKYHPASPPHWSFAHLTIQEFFAGYYLAKVAKETEVTEFGKLCCQISKLEKNIEILKFLGGINVKKASQILQLVIEKTTNRDDCKQLINLLLKIISQYQTLSGVSLPVPCFLDVDDKIKDHEKALEWLLTSTSENLGNLQGISTENPAHPIYQTCIGYAKDLILRVGSDGSAEDVDGMASSMSKMKNLTALSLDIVKEPGTKIQDSLVKLSTQQSQKISELKIKGKGIFTLTRAILSKMTNLQTLVLQLLEENISENDIQDLCNAIEKTSTVNHVHLELDKLCNGLLQINEKVKLTLFTRKTDPASLKIFVYELEKAEPKPGISSIEFAENHEFQNMGKELGHLMSCLPSLTSLNLSKCGLEAKTIGIIKDAGDQPNMKNLSLRDNNLQGCQEDLGRLLKHMPHLLKLDLRMCQLKDDDVNGTVKGLEKCTHLENVRLRGNIIGDTAADTLGKVLPSWPKLQTLDIWNCGIKALTVRSMICESADKQLKQLRILNMGYNPSLRDEGIKHLASNLEYMHQLEVLSVANCGCINDDTLPAMVLTLPPSLKHLDIHDNYRHTYVSKEDQHKEKLAKLQRLNIGYRYESENDKVVEAVREELLMINEDIKVYYDDSEDLWSMYVNPNKDVF